MQGQLGAYEQYKGCRQRKRKPLDQINYDKAVAAIVCDTVHRHLLLPGQWLAQSLSKRYVRKSRYRSTVLGK